MEQLRQLTVQAEEDGLKLIDFLGKRLDLSRRSAKKLVDSRHVHVNRKRVWMARHMLYTGDQVDITLADQDTGYLAPSILHQDDDILIFNKPAGMLTVEDDTSLDSWARSALGEPDLACVHRLDRNTSGCVIAVRNPSLFPALKEQFRKREVDKRYQAIVHGRTGSTDRTIDHPIDGRPAITHMKVRATAELASHVELRIETGRTHQIRLHLASIRHPVAGDTQYVQRSVESPALRAVPRQMLHASRLQFNHPVQKSMVTVDAPLPEDFTRCLSGLGLVQNAG